MKNIKKYISVILVSVSTLFLVVSYNACGTGFELTSFEDTSSSQSSDSGDQQNDSIIDPVSINPTNPIVIDPVTTEPIAPLKEPETAHCTDAPAPQESELVRGTGSSSEYFVNLGFEDGVKAGLGGTFTTDYCYSGGRSLDSRSTLGKAYSTGGRVDTPRLIRPGEEIWIRLRVFFPESYKFASCTTLGLNNCDQDEPNPSIKFIGINFTVWNQGRHWLNIWHDSTDNSFAWVYEGNPSTYKRMTENRITKGQWETFEYYTKFSTTPGVASTRVYKNGKLIVSSSHRTINNNDMNMDALFLLQYWNGGAPASQSVYFDEIIMTNKKPIKTDQNGDPYLGI